MFDPLTSFDRLFARAVNVFVYISNAVASGYVQQGIPPTEGVIVHNAVDLKDFTPRAATSLDGQSVRSEFGWTTEQRLVGVIGRLDWWKGHEYFLQAIARVVGRVPNLKALIVGERQDSLLNRAYYDRLKSLTHSLGLEDKVVFTGFRSDIPRLMSEMDIVVLSSATPEPFGRVVIEAMAASTPVVATAAGGVLDIVEDGVNGLLVPCRDAAAMAQGIADLLLDPNKADRMGRAARRRVEAAFSVDKHVDAIQTLYDSILSAGHPSRAPSLQAATPSCQAPGGQS
jgi:glycosyltransferase involved in cell wall biosynthesis